MAGVLVAPQAGAAFGPPPLPGQMSHAGIQKSPLTTQRIIHEVEEIGIVVSHYSSPF